MLSVSRATWHLWCYLCRHWMKLIKLHFKCQCCVCDILHLTIRANTLFMSHSSICSKAFHVSPLLLHRYQNYWRLLWYSYVRLNPKQTLEDFMYPTKKKRKKVYPSDIHLVLRFWVTFDECFVAGEGERPVSGWERIPSHIKECLIYVSFSSLLYSQNKF